MTKDIASIIKMEFERRLIKESFSRIEKCGDLLTEEEFWRKPNENSNSIGNLVLHLTGNVRQYINTGIAGEKDIRNRDEEFNDNRQVGKIQTIKDLGEVLLSAKNIVDMLDIKSLSENRRVQGFDETVLSILIHVIEQAKQKGLRRLSLETGSMEFFEPARLLYEKHGFVYCEPFGDYELDPNSQFMTLELS